MIAVSFSVPFENPGLQKNGIQIWILGIGLSAATAALAAYLSRERPQLLIISGFAGALHPRIQVGETFLCENMSDLDAVRTLQGKGWVLPPSATLHTSTQLVATAKAKADLHQATGSDLVDMETQSLLEIARFHSIPVVTIRTVSDAATLDFPLPEVILYDKRRQRTRPIALCAYLSRNPHCIPGFIRMLKHLSHARSQLGGHLRSILNIAAQ